MGRLQINEYNKWHIFRAIDNAVINSASVAGDKLFLPLQNRNTLSTSMYSDGDGEIKEKKIHAQGAYPFEIHPQQ